MLLSLVLLVSLAGPLTAYYRGPSLPDIILDHDDGCLQFRMPHAPGLKEVFFKYMYEKLVDKFRIGKATYGGDGFWRLRDDFLRLSPGDRIQYNVYVLGWLGSLQGPVSNWTYAPTTTIPPTRMQGAVIFREDFSGASNNGRLDLNKWKIEVSLFGGMNWEFQAYTNQDNNVYLKDGYLYLKPFFTVDDPKFDENFLTTGKMDCSEIWGQCTNSGNFGCVREGQYGMLPPVMSGKVMSIPSITYGIVEVRACIPKGDWIWPAIWMLPKDNKYGGWPRSGEIDMMESRGNEQAIAPDGVNHGVNEISSTLHWGPAWNQNYYPLTHAEKIKQQGNWHSSCHTWRLERTPEELRTFVDDEELLRVVPPAGGFYQYANMTGENIWANGTRMAPFDQEFFLILNVAVGGTNGYFPDDWNYGQTLPKNNAEFWNSRANWSSSWVGDDVAMKIDYVEFRDF